MQFNDITIREALESDMEAIQALYRDDMRVARAEGRPSSLGSPYPQADRDAMERQAGGEKRHQVMVAEKGGQVIGYVRALHRLDKREPQKPTEAGAKQTTLHKLVVLEANQKEGIGGQLMQSVIDRAQELNRETIRVSLPECGPIAFYQRMGFEPITTLPAPKETMQPVTMMDMDVPQRKQGKWAERIEAASGRVIGLG